MKTLVIGGTGTVGKLVVEGLTQKGETVRVLTRNKNKTSFGTNVEVFEGDLTNPTTSMTDAFTGIDAVFMLNAVTMTETHEGLMGLNFAKNANVKKFVYMGVHNATAGAHIPHFGSKIGIETAIKQSGMTWTLLQPNNFFQNDYWLKDAILQHNVYPQPLGDKGLHRVDTRDIADAAVNALTKAGFENKAYVLCGPKPLNGAASAETWTAHVGKKVSYMGNDLNAWEKQMSSMMPAWMLFDMKTMYSFFQTHGLLATNTELAECEKIVGHSLRTFDAFCKETAATWK